MTSPGGTGSQPYLGPELERRSAKLAEAAEMLMRYPAAVQIRYVQTLREVASERNTTPFVSIPMNLLEPILNAITTNSAS